jgi:shikimate kinase
MMKTIVLVGFPGSGKSTIGRRLAARLSLPFYDTDSYFEAKYRITISDFFTKYGEEFFRICEHRVLTELLSLPPCVIATGGGTPCFFDSMSLIQSSALSVYIKLSSKSLSDRLLHSKKVRPLLLGKSPEQLMAYIDGVLPQRELYYSQAEICVKGENIDVNALVDSVQKLLL